MSKAAIPSYMGKHLAGQDIAPGHRFGLYFPVWQNDWSRAESAKKDALKTVATSLPPNSIKLAESLQKRQLAIALQNPQLAYFPAKSTAPFMTGMGNEHPLENGFAFLNPYGLPYLPGSSVKGVLRTAAEQLALGLYGETGGWDMLSVWWLFGFEAGGSMFQGKPYQIDVLDEEAHRRQQAYQSWLETGDYDQDTLNCFIKAVVEKKDQKKYLEQPKDFLIDLINKKALREALSNQDALCFWDVYPQSKNLAMEIMTPHHMGYFQGKNGVLNAPHDSEQPNPIVFLTLPPNSLFDFYCTCNSASLPETLRQNWQALIQTAFEYAFDWLGFGAKTAVGYGQMQLDNSALATLEESRKQAEFQAQQREEAKRLADLPTVERDMAQLLKENKDPNKKPYLVLLEVVKSGRWQDNDRQQVLQRIQQLMLELGDWRPTTLKKDPSKDKEHQRTLEVQKLLAN
ncbi:MAG: type III-B CRISPR module RAMP protein Cmr6 [Proteobacteria bacterium ST_bin11]|nr:MAG: type III-B CRISPR module RAMP protein Cmr6 [Proteobacteria bacterium ST_bin11]